MAPANRPRRAPALPVALLLAVVAAGLCTARAGKLDPKGAKITLQAKWGGTPLLHEAAEFMADEDPALFYKFVEGWQEASAGLDGSSEQCWEGIRATAARHLTPTMHRLFGLSLAARQYSARLEMYRQLAEEGRGAAGTAGSCCWALLGGKVYTEAAALVQALEAVLGGQDGGSTGGSTGAVYPFDHVYRHPDSPAPPVNITAPDTIPVELYAPIGSLCGAQLHATLSSWVVRSDAAAAAASGPGGRQRRLAYAWRPLLGSASGVCSEDEVHPCNLLGTSGRLVLPGFGVELALKNMEYNAQDDSKKDDKSGGGGKGEEEEGGDEEGAEGQEAAEPTPSPAPQTSDDGVMQVTLKNLGLQAAQRIIDAAESGGGEDPLLTLQEIAQDFPRLVESLSQQRYVKSLRTAVTGMQRYIPHGAQFLLVNGLVQEAHDFNLYDFLDVMRREVRLYDALASLALPPGQLREALLLRGAAAGNDEAPRLHLKSDDYIAWVNDLERDDQYSRWPRDLNQFLMPMFPGRLPTVARNALTAIFLFDPASPAALDIGSMVYQMHTQSWPLRMGLVPVVPQRIRRLQGLQPGEDEMGAEVAPSERMARLLSSIAHHHGVPTVAMFLQQLRSALPEELDEAADFASSLWETAVQTVRQVWEAWGEEGGGGDDDGTGVTVEEVIRQAVSGEGGEPKVLSFLQGAAELAYNAGLAGQAKAGVLVCNGAVSGSDAGSGWRGAIMQAVQTQMQAVQEDVYMQRLTNSATDVYEEILKLHGSIPRYNPRILPLEGGGPGYIRISGETDEYRTRQLALTGPLLGLNATSAAALRLRYFGPELPLLNPEDGEPEAPPPLASVTHWVVADVASRAGVQLAAAALQHRSRSGRVGLLINSQATTGAAEAEAGEAGGSGFEVQVSPIERYLVAVASGLIESEPLTLTEQLDSVLQQPKAPAALTLPELDDLLSLNGQLAQTLADLAGVLPDMARRHTRFARSTLDLPAGANAVVTNGRLLELPDAKALAEEGKDPGEAVLSTQDFELLELLAGRQLYAGQVASLVRAVADEEEQRALEQGDHQEAGAPTTSRDLSDVAAVLSSVLAASKPEEIDGRSGRVSELITDSLGQRNVLHLMPQASGQGQGQAGDSQAQAQAQAAPVFIQVVLNPLSKAAQRLAPLLRMLRGVLDVDMHLMVNPQREISEMPLKTFYRYTLPSTDASLPPQPAAAVFTGLPPNKVLTLGMDEPEPWLVEPVQAEYDLDNLRLEDLGEGRSQMEAVYELEALMLTGMCLDLTSLSARIRDQIHPRGVQLQLLPMSAGPGAGAGSGAAKGGDATAAAAEAAAAGAGAGAPLVDTLVMSNLGYFQLKSKPGLWRLRLAPGRSQQLFSVASSTGASSSGQKAEAAVAGADALQVPVALNSFSGKHMHLFLRKHPDQLHEDVLQQAEDGDGGDNDGREGAAGGGGSLWKRVASTLSSSWGGDSEGDADSSGSGGVPAKQSGGGGVAEEQETIHVFTVASGHMYERLQKIMILSVIKRTPARVKFWFIKNYMSPQMKAFVPYMAKKYNFDYEFVTYKWPSWLHKQTEKQRIIWAYKILFLDVLFPLGLKKVIFCDSDQVVRADLRELWNMDLKGAPYGYTPFCDNNRDMEGFRFWKQGFWKEHLRGQPYHISALYVVDLKRFRELAAGDRLRVMYDGLSKDPNSLANLDQDLPNYAQHGVPIFSLPNEWLWCETWCGNQTRKQAKTIDLCNNPLTKEPKLQSARRIIAEWPDLNREAEEFTAAVERVQHGEWSEGQLLADESAFHVRLTPMVEGSTWTSERGDTGAGAGDEAGSGSGSGSGDSSGGAGEGVAAADHDESEL